MTKLDSKEKKIVKLVSISFPRRDLGLAPVSLKNYALSLKEFSEKWLFQISQYDLKTSTEDIYNDLSNNTVKVYGFTAYVWNMEKTLEVAKKLKDEFPERTIILGGPEASGMGVDLLKNYEFIDYGFFGEAEESFSSFLLGEKLSLVPGLIYRKNGLVVMNPENLIRDLDKLPLPYENEDYRSYLDNSPIPVRAAIETSRGCPFDCSYCTWGSIKMRYFDIEKLKPAFRYLFNHPNVASIYITDSNPFLKKDRSVELLEFIIKENVNKKRVTFELAPEFVTSERVLELILELGNEEFAFGLQSTSSKVLNQINRKFDPVLYKRNVDYLRKLKPGIEMWFSLILGLPSDNYYQFLDSTEFALSLNPTGIYFHELVGLPGSELNKNPELFGVKFMDKAPHFLIENESFPKKAYNKAKFLSYHIYLFHRLNHLQDKIYGVNEENLKSFDIVNYFFNLHKEQTEQKIESRLVDYYINFVDHLAENLDALNGKKIEEVTSWQFEENVNEFVKNPKNLKLLEHLFESFKDENVVSTWTPLSLLKTVQD
ncbi:MAG: radical SAM protein [Candidatus Hodarchaeales archaeon]